MAYTRTYPIVAGRDYTTGLNPLLEQKATLTSGTGTITGVLASYITTMITAPWVPSDWFVTIRDTVDSADIGSYKVAGTAVEALLVTRMDGTGFTAAATGPCKIAIFNSKTPSVMDTAPEAFLVTVAGTGNFTGITTDGQYFDIPGTSFAAMGIYDIGVKKVINTGGMTGYLLGSSGYCGSPLI